MILSIAVHVLVALAVLFGPKLPYFQRLEAERQAQLAKEAELLQQQQQKDQARFVYVVPKIDIQAKKPPPRAELSDKDRIAQALLRAPNPKNMLPFSRGNTTDRTEAQKQAREKPRGQGPQPEPSTAQQSQQTANATNGQQQPQANTAPLPVANNGTVSSANKPTQDPNRGQQASAAGGSLGQALRNLEKYTDSQTFNNPEGNVGQVGPSIQFDTKGVEFGPWIRRFIAQVKRNWFIPMAAMSLKGHVVLQFRIHKSGAITDLVVVQPSSIEAFTNAAVNAIRGSNPTQPLPPEYPDENALFTVTFYYNETPP